MAVKTVNIKALVCSQNKNTFYCAVIDSKILSEMCFVARREEDPLKGFQRVLNESRAKEISKYLDEDQGTIPTAIIVSVQDNALFEYNEIRSEIIFRVVEKGFLVLDGQHRLYGLRLAKKNYNIPVIIFKSLSTKSEVNLFIDINTKQKGVPTALIVDIKELAGRETKLEEKQRELFNLLNKKSALAGYLSPNKSVSGKISRVTFNSATEGIFKNVLFQDKDVSIIYKAIQNYVDAVERVFIKSKSSKAKIYNSVLFRAYFGIFDDVIERSYRDFHNLKMESMELVLEPISKLNYDAYIGTNRTTIDRVTSDMRNEVKSYNNINSDNIQDLL